ncbi:MAG: glycosyltransferase family 4 protein [Colwellia sp.]|nr:glycosyltransferase family 4 protein [Colwellia sp.]
MIIFEASPVAYAYENPLADTGITRVIKNILIHLEGALNDKDFNVFLYAQENLWNQFLLNKFVHEASLIKIKPLICGDLLNHCNSTMYSKSIDDLIELKAELQGKSIHPSVIEDLVRKEKAIFHSNFLKVPDFIRNIRGLEVLFTVHDIFPLSHKGLFTSDVARFYEDYLATYRKADNVACVSNYTAEQFRKKVHYVDEQNIIAIPNAGNHAFLEDVCEYALEKYHLQLDNYFICVSTLEPRKNFPSVVRAFLKYINNNENSSQKKLVIVGSKGWMDDVENSFLLEQEQLGNIVLTGRVSDGELRALVEGARLFISGSYCEGFGLGALEALTVGTPALVPANTAQIEVVTGYGVVLDDWVPSKIAKVMQDFDDENYYINAAALASKVTDKYSWKRTANEYLQLYRKIIEV